MPTLPHRRFPFWIPALLFVLLIVGDQALKVWAEANLVLHRDPIPFLPGLIEWELTYNTGAAWSLFSGSAKVLAAGRLLVGLGIMVYLYLKPQNRFLSVVLTLIAAGAVGNAIDGLTKVNGVTDMIHSPLLSAVTRALNFGKFPIFNLADSCVVGGTILLLIASFLPEKKPPVGEEQADSAQT